MPLCKSVAGSTVAVVVSVDALEPLHLLDNLHGILFDQCFVREDVLLLCAAVQVCARQDVGNCSKSGENTFNSFHVCMCVYLWNNMAMNWMTTMAKKKNTRTIPMGSRCKYSLVTMIWGRANSDSVGIKVLYAECVQLYFMIPLC